MTYYIYAEDLAAGLIGPFGDVQQALRHIEFCRVRGDADPGRVVTESEAEGLRAVAATEMTPEQDREFVV